MKYTDDTLVSRSSRPIEGVIKLSDPSSNNKRGNNGGSGGGSDDSGGCCGGKS